MPNNGNCSSLNNAVGRLGTFCWFREQEGPNLHSWWGSECGLPNSVLEPGVLFQGKVPDKRDLPVLMETTVLVSVPWECGRVSLFRVSGFNYWRVSGFCLVYLLISKWEYEIEVFFIYG